MCKSYQNVDKLLCFSKTDGSIRAISSYPISGSSYVPCGTNFYFGINTTNVTAFATNGTAIDPNRHKPFFDQLLLDTATYGDLTLIVSLEPPSDKDDPASTDPFDYVAQHLDLVEALASELKDIRSKASDNGGRLTIVLRYASEMNDLRYDHLGALINPYGSQPDQYKQTYVAVRDIFENIDPSILFCFSPAIRADLSPGRRPTLPTIDMYWPGDDYVNIISCTWYVGQDADFQAASEFVRTYILHRVVAARPFAIDEIGGCSINDDHNDLVLQNMFGVIASVPGVSLEYATIFLEGKWGTDATLNFL